MTSLEEMKQQESALKYKLENTKRIDERRALRKELRELRDRKEKFIDENGNLRDSSRTHRVASKFTMKVGGSNNDTTEQSHLTNSEPPIKKAAQEVQKTTRSTYSLQMSSNKDIVDNKPSGYGVKSAIGESSRGKENEGTSKAPNRISRRASLAELFKLESGAPSKQVAKPVETVRPQIVVPPPSTRNAPDSDRETQAKYDLMKNISRLRCRRRSIRDLQTQNNKEELDGLMYVKTDGAVKLVSTTEGEEQAKEQRRIRRVSRKESAEKLNVSASSISHKTEKELEALPEERPASQVRTGGPTRQEFKTQPGNFGISYGTANRPGPDAKKFEPTQSRSSSTGFQQGRPEPKSFLSNGPTQPKKLSDRYTAPPPSKPAGGGGGGGPFGSGSVADRMAFFRKAAEDESKAKQKQFTPPPKPTPSPIPTPTTPTSPTSPKSPGEKPSLKKAPDPNRTPRELKKKPQLKRQMSVSSMVLEWCKDVTRGYNGVNITNFSGSFANGLAFCALIHKFNPDKFDFDSLDSENRERNFRLAFETGASVGVPALLDVEDMVRMKKPEPRSVQCYVQMIFSKYRPKDMDMSNLVIA